jgi:hypothetical protein
MCQGACKPGSVPRAVSWRTDARRQPFISATGCPAAPATNPGLSGRNTPASTPKSSGARPLFGLAPGGVCHADAVAGAPVRSYRTLSPMPVPFRGHRRYTLCGTFPELRAETFHPAGVTRHPRFTEPGLSSASDPLIKSVSKDAAARPPGGAYLVRPRSRSKSSWNRIARNSPSITPSIRSGRQRLWNASTAIRPSVMS